MEFPLSVKSAHITAGYHFEDYRAAHERRYVQFDVEPEGQHEIRLATGGRLRGSRYSAPEEQIQATVIIGELQHDEVGSNWSRMTYIPASSTQNNYSNERINFGGFVSREKFEELLSMLKGGSIPSAIIVTFPSGPDSSQSSFSHELAQDGSILNWKNLIIDIERNFRVGITGFSFHYVLHSAAAHSLQPTLKDIMTSVESIRSLVKIFGTLATSIAFAVAIGLLYLIRLRWLS